MTLRRLKVLINGLPSNSMYKAKLRGITDGQRWGDVEYLLAFLADMLQAQYGVAYVGVTNKTPPPMTPYPRPEFVSQAEIRDEEANAKAEELLGLWSSGALQIEQPAGPPTWIDGAPADHRNGLLPSGIEQLPETGGTTTTE
ncbi:hypothetical protein AB0I87_13575 [Streptomyces sp. NPDC049952]|uniref:hypothetical protein n=1 Tax=Streptomyces sp. NPDC049952 TaxID=3156665 RepID=UPI0034170096